MFYRYEHYMSISHISVYYGYATKSAHFLDIFFSELLLISFMLLNGFKYFYPTRIFLFTINHLFSHLNDLKYFYATVTI